MDEADEPKDATIMWHGNSLEVLRTFPDKVKENMGHDLRLLQTRQQPLDYRAVTSIGSGVFELRDEDERAWYRTIYLSRVEDVIHVLHCFEKKSREIPKNDREVAEKRYKQVKEKIAEEKRRAKRGH